MFFSEEKPCIFAGLFLCAELKKFWNREHFFDFALGRKTEFCSAQF
jgi:hypothetical protein